MDVEKKKICGFPAFHNTPVKTYPHKFLNVSKGIIRSKELSLCTIKKSKENLKSKEL